MQRMHVKYNFKTLYVNFGLFLVTVSYNATMQDKFVGYEILKIKVILRESCVC